MSRRFAVIGGGIAGLATAYEIEKKDPTAEVVVFEASERTGGKVRTAAIDGMTVEEGPDSFLPRDPAPVELCRELGLGDDLVEPRGFGAWVWRAGKLVRIPQGFVLGVPASPAAILRARILSPAGILRAAADLVLPGPLAGPDVSIGSYVRWRFGVEVLARLVDPLLAGARAGDVHDMSLAAAAPELDRAARTHRSATLGLRRALSADPGSSPRFYGIRGGMQRLTEALRDALRRTEIATSARVVAVGRTTHAYSIHTSEEHVRSDAVVVCVPAPAASGVLEHLDPDAGALVERIRFAPAVVVTLAYRPGAVDLPKDGSGFLVPSGENKTIAGCTWFSSKWPHAAPADGRVVLRAFVGRAVHDPALRLRDDELVARITAEVGDAMSIAEAPVSTHLVRWPHGLPQLEVGHLRLMDRIEEVLRRHPGVALAGAGYRGTGIVDCLAQAKAAAGAVAGPS